jgi:hypothetical protein
MDDGRDTAPTYERKVFGEHETIELPVASFVRLPQVRSGMNPDLPELKQSIKTRGLLNQIDAARMSEEQLVAYVDFVNRTWKTHVTLDDYAHQQQPDGHYYVVIAGHTRTEAVYQLQEEDEAGFEYAMIAKVHPISTPEEIIGLQLDENIHSKPAQEQRAIAVVETYRYGLEQGLWKSKADFLRQSKEKFSRKVLDEALGFAQLPLEARDFVFSGNVSYNAGVALGLATDTIMDYVAVRLGYLEEMPAEAAEEFDDAYRLEIGKMVAHISNRGLNGPAAKKYIAGQVEEKKKKMKQVRDDSVKEGALFDMSFISPREQAETYKKELRKRYEAALRDMQQSSIGAVTDALNLHRRLIGEEGTAELERERQARERHLGGRAVADANKPDSVAAA